jgi:hypothetical protein
MNNTRWDIGFKTNPAEKAERAERCERVPVIFTVDSLYRNYAVEGRMRAGRSEISHTNFPRHDYTVPLPSALRDVVAIELVKAVIPVSPCDEGDKDRYVILNIGYARAQGNSQYLTGSFCNIYTTEDGTKYDYTHTDISADAAHTYYFPEPTTVGKLHITLLYPDGTVPQYPDDSKHRRPVDHVLTFKIWTLNQPVIFPL